jgi:hypothetical protein
VVSRPPTHAAFVRHSFFAADARQRIAVGLPLQDLVRKDRVIFDRAGPHSFTPCAIQERFPRPYTIYSNDLVKFPTQAQQCRIPLYLRARVFRLRGVMQALSRASSCRTSAASPVYVQKCDAVAANGYEGFALA